LESKIESIKKPVRYVSLNGIITTVYSNSGLVKRCNKCKSIMYDTCPNKCSKEGWDWDLRVSSRLYDGSGSIKMVLTKDIASRVLNRNLGELILLASQNKPLAQNLQRPSSVKIKIPENIKIIEAVKENASAYRSNGKLIVTDGRNLVFFPPELEEEEAHKFSEHIKRPLKTLDVEDRKIIKKLIEKALDIRIKKVTGMRMMQGHQNNIVDVYVASTRRLGRRNYSIYNSIKSKNIQISIFWSYLHICNYTKSLS
jgi:hypothetical protein